MSDKASPDEDKSQTGRLRHKSSAVKQKVKGSGVLTDEQWQAVAERFKLTAREILVIRTSLDGLSEAAIALQLQISKHTVHTHFRRIYRKLRVSGRLELLVVIVATIS
jgi:DNA-binding CsgD family transcriptional regulator